jgi:phosphatidate cytidylyltransferase
MNAPLTPNPKWGDLPARLGSAVVMVIVGATAIWLGGIWFLALMAVVVSAMVWELVTMLDPALSTGRRLGLGISAGVMLVATAWGGLLPMLLIPTILGAVLISKDRALYASYCLAIMLACFCLYALRDLRGINWVIWLVGVVVITDIAGYFVGRLLGGPKFWPRISPKKTWSGTAGGWLGAAMFGYYLSGVDFAIFSVLVAFASQLGDIAESAIKRRTGVKDSSNLIPGHGGFLDRFDGMIAAALLVWLVGASIGLPGA